MDLEADAAGIGALADDTRRLLYEYVAAQPGPVSREQAATALGLVQHNVTFHLERLAEEGLLEVEFRRLSGRSGPGAGRPSKLYRRADREFAVSLPPRQYDVVGDILAVAVTRAAAGEATLPETLQQAAHERGHELGVSAGPRATPPLAAVAEVLGSQGYEPRVTDGDMLLANCPFDALAQRHTALVCGLNRDFVQGVADGLGCDDVVAALEPAPGRCCVRARLR